MSYYGDLTGEQSDQISNLCTILTLKLTPYNHYTPLKDTLMKNSEVKNLAHYPVLRLKTTEFKSWK